MVSIDRSTRIKRVHTSAADARCNRKDGPSANIVRVGTAYDVLLYYTALQMRMYPKVLNLTAGGGSVKFTYNVIISPHNDRLRNILRFSDTII